MMIATRQRITDILLHIQDAFLNTPGLTLTLIEARLLFGLDETTCSAILKTLVDANVLTYTHDGAYVRQIPALTAA